jgi:hypothetical protein
VWSPAEPTDRCERDTPVSPGRPARKSVSWPWRHPGVHLTRLGSCAYGERAPASVRTRSAGRRAGGGGPAGGGRREGGGRGAGARPRADGEGRRRPAMALVGEVEGERRGAGEGLVDDAVALGEPEQRRQLLVVGVGVELDLHPDLAEADRRLPVNTERAAKVEVTSATSRPPRTGISSAVAAANRVTPAGDQCLEQHVARADLHARATGLAGARSASRGASPHLRPQSGPAGRPKSVAVPPDRLAAGGSARSARFARPVVDRWVHPA